MSTQTGNPPNHASSSSGAIPASTGSVALKVMVIGIEELSEKVIAPAAGHLARISHSYDLEKLMEMEPDPLVGAIFCGPPPADVSLSEIAQMLRMQYQNCPIFYLTTVRVGFDRKTIQKNGFTDAFLIPFDAKVCETSVKEALALKGAAAEKVYRAVKIIDVTPGEVLTFDAYLHLPTNNKYVKFAVSGDPLDADRAERLKKHQVKNLQVTVDQMQEFYKFTAAHLKKIGESSTMSETERQEKLQSSVRELIGGIFSDNTKDGSFEAGKSIVEDCQQIVKSFIVQGNAKNDWFARFMNMASSSTGVYNHATNVATFAGLFSMGMGIGKPEDMAMAGILHDIGISELPVELQLKSEKDFTPEELEGFKKHIDHTIKLMKDRKLIVPEIVMKAITQHHERWNGTGYPKALAGKRICPEAQLLALADLFDELTSDQPGSAGDGNSVRLNPVQALFKIREMNGLDGSSAIFDPEMIAKLFKLFPIDLNGSVAA